MVALDRGRCLCRGWFASLGLIWLRYEDLLGLRWFGGGASFHGMAGSVDSGLKFKAWV